MKTTRNSGRLFLLPTVVLLFFGAVCWADKGVYNITDYGAKGDGKTLNTEAIQKAVDTCTKAGGGRVVVPAGRFVTGTIVLKDNVELHITHGATILGSRNYLDYPCPPKPKFPCQKDPGKWYALFYAEGAKRIALTGTGTIDGQGEHIKPRGGDDHGTGDSNGRPRLIWFISCKDVRVQDLHLRNSAIWMQHYLDCENVFLRGLNVWNHAQGVPNNDGINIDCCRQVTVSDCIIDSGDDAIAIKSTGPGVSKNISISNCVMKSRQSAIKLGTESHGGYENISITGCSIFGSRGYGIGLEMNDGGVLQQVAISNITMQNVHHPIVIQFRDRGRKYKPDMERPGIGVLRNVTISNINIKGTHDVTAIALEGLDGNHELENISLNDIRLSINGGPMTEDYQNKNRASLLYGRFVKGLRVSNLQLVTDNPDQRRPVVLNRINGLMLDSIDIPESLEGRPMIRLDQVNDVIVRGCQPAGDTFVEITGDETSNIMFVGNNFAKIKNPLKMGTEIAKDEINVFSNKLPN